MKRVLKMGQSVLSAAPDGKLYDAYVSFLDSKTLSSAQTAHFVLQILPEELERKSGYSLYIRGRDDCPGEGQEQMLSSFILHAGAGSSLEASPLWSWFSTWAQHILKCLSAFCLNRLELNKLRWCTVHWHKSSSTLSKYFKINNSSLSMT